MDWLRKMSRRKLLNNRVYWDMRASALNAYARRKGATDKVTGPQLKALYLASYGECHWCGAEMVLGPAYTDSQKNRVMSYDHVVRLADGGLNIIENLVCACRSCNAGRHDGNMDTSRSLHSERYEDDPYAEG